MKREIIKIFSGALIFTAALLLKTFNSLPLFLLAYLILGHDVLFEAAKSITEKDFFNECTLMAVATIGAFCIKSYAEAVSVMLLYSIGELLQDSIEEKSEQNISSLMDLEVQFARRIHEEVTEKVKPEEVEIGELISVLPGEKVPLDGIIVKGSAYGDTSSITGESIAIELTEGTEVLSGTIIEKSPVVIRVQKTYKNSTVSKIMDIVKQAENSKAPTERFITRFSEKYTPLVVISAFLMFLIPSLITGNWKIWTYRALTFLVVSCPCALVISVPLAFFAGIGNGAGKGILIKSGNTIETLSKVNICVFDKTGTLTNGEIKVSEVKIDKELLPLVYGLEKSSTHPIAKAIENYCFSNNIGNLAIDNIEEVPGFGLTGNYQGKKLICGKEELLSKNGISFTPNSDVSSGIIYASYDGKYIGYITVNDTLKDNAKAVMNWLRKLGITKLAMLSGDRENVARSVSEELKLDYFKAGLLPDQKVKAMEDLKNQGTCLYCGDGINDAPVLISSDVGLSMGKIGSDAAIQASSVVVVSDNLDKIPTALKISRKTVSIAKQNVVFALAFKFICLVLATLGIASMSLAAFADSGVAVLCVLNSVRALKNA